MNQKNDQKMKNKIDLVSKNEQEGHHEKNDRKNGQRQIAFGFWLDQFGFRRVKIKFFHSSSKSKQWKDNSV